MANLVDDLSFVILINVLYNAVTPLCYLSVASLHSITFITESWKKLEFYDLLRLLQPMEAKWEGLGYLLVKDYEIQAIKANSFHSNASNQAMFEAVRKWTGRTVREHRKWRTLLHVAKKWGDNTLSQFLMDNNLNGE